MAQRTGDCRVRRRVLHGSPLACFGAGSIPGMVSRGLAVDDFGWRSGAQARVGAGQFGATFGRRRRAGWRRRCGMSPEAAGLAALLLLLAQALAEGGPGLRPAARRASGAQGEHGTDVGARPAHPTPLSRASTSSL